MKLRCVRGRLFPEQQQKFILFLYIYICIYIYTRVYKYSLRASCSWSRFLFHRVPALPRRVLVFKVGRLVTRGRATSVNSTRFTMGNYQQASSPYASMPSLYISGAKTVGGTPPIVVQPPLLLFAARLPETMLAVLPR